VIVWHLLTTGCLLLPSVSIMAALFVQMKDFSFNKVINGAVVTFLDL
jgi:hypothetical protein